MDGGRHTERKGQPGKDRLCKGDRKDVIGPGTQFHKSMRCLLASLRILESFAFLKRRQREGVAELLRSRQEGNATKNEALSP